MIRFNSTNLFDTRIELGSLPYKAEMIKRVKIGHMETETRKYAYPFNLRVNTSGMKGVGGIEYHWGM